MKIYTNDILTTAAAAIMLLTACTSDVATEQGSDSRVPIKLASNIAMTRGTQDTQLTSGENVYVWANVMQTNDNGSTWTTDWTLGAYIKAWRLTSDGGTGWSDISKVQYYPPCPLTMMATHGNFTGITDDVTSIPATITHNVATDQSLLADYAKSDLLYWASDNSGNGYTTSTPTVNMVFTHKLSKIEITLDATNSDYTADQLAQAVVRLNGILPTVTMNMTTTTSGDLSAASGTAQQIISYSPSALHYEAIIPPQAKTVGVIAITLDGYTIPITPAYPASNFEGNTRYQYTIALGNQEATVQSSISAWGYNVDGGNLATYQVANYDLRKLPLWYVAEKNVDYTAADGTKTWDSGAGTFSFAEDDNAGYYLSWKDLMEAFCYKQGTTYSNNTLGGSQDTYEGTLGAQCKIAGYHLPIQKEWCGIIPGASTISIFSFENNNGGTFGIDGSISCVWGYNSDTRSNAGIADKSFWYQEYVSEFKKVLYGLRFLGTPYCSIWKYEFQNSAVSAWSDTDYGYLKLTARIISDTELMNSANFTDENKTNEVCRAYLKKYSWASHFTGLTFTNGNDETHGAVQRVFYARGYANGSGKDLGGREYNKIGYYPSATENIATEAKGMWVGFSSTFIFNNGGTKNLGWTVRLFRDSYDYLAPKTTIATATISDLAIGDIVCSDGSIYNASDAGYVALAKKNPVGVIAYVGTAGTVDTSLGSSSYKALVVALKDAGPYCSWYTANNNTCVAQNGTYATICADLKGIEYTKRLAGGCNAGHVHAAASQALNFSVLRPANTSQWFLPTIGQWKLIVEGITGQSGLNTSDQDKFKTAAFNIKIIAVGGTGVDDVCYSTSVESGTGNLWGIYFKYGKAYSGASKVGDTPVRPVFAF